jgi:hypothetical protein
MDQTTRDQLYAHTLVWCWPWLWWQLWRLDLYVWTTGRDVAFAVDTWGNLRIKFIGDDPYAPKAWTPYSMQAYVKPFEIPDGACAYAHLQSGNLDAEAVILTQTDISDAGKRGLAWVTTDPMKVQPILKPKYNMADLIPIRPAICAG